MVVIIFVFNRRESTVNQNKNLKKRVRKKLPRKAQSVACHPGTKPARNNLQEGSQGNKYKDLLSSLLSHILIVS